MADPTTESGARRTEEATPTRWFSIASSEGKAVGSGDLKVLREGDWLSIDADTPKDLLGTAYFARSTDLLALMHATLAVAPVPPFAFRATRPAPPDSVRTTACRVGR